jgi:hypothetical protein
LNLLSLLNTYSFLLKNTFNQSSEKEINSFYFELLENQYLSKEIDFENI